MTESSYGLHRHVRDALRDVLNTIPADRRDVVANSVGALIQAHGGQMPEVSRMDPMDPLGAEILVDYSADLEHALCQAAYRFGDRRDEGWDAEVWEGASQPVDKIRAPNGVVITPRLESTILPLVLEVRPKEWGTRRLRVTLEDSIGSPALIQALVELLVKHAGDPFDETG